MQNNIVPVGTVLGCVVLILEEIKDALGRDKSCKIAR